VDTFGEHFKKQQNQALIDVDPTTFETLELPHEASTWPLSFHDDLKQLAWQAYVLQMQEPNGIIGW